MYFEFRETDIDRHIQTADAGALLSVWRRHAGAGGLPEADAVWAEGVARLEPYLLWVEPAGEDDWHYAVVGSRLAEERGLHWRHPHVSGLAEPSRSFVRRCFATVVRRAEPAYAIHTAPECEKVLLWERLVLPCRGRGGGICLLVFLRPLEYVEDMIRTVLDSTPGGILRARCIRDAEGRIVDAVCLLANERAAALLRRPPGELVKGCLLELFPHFLESGVFARLAGLVETRQPCSFEMEYRDSGALAWFSVSAAPLGDGFTLSLTDVTALKRVNLELERARTELIAMNGHLERQALDLEAAIADANAARHDLEAEVECRKVLEEELRRLAMTDTLTGLANRPALIAHGQALVAGVARRGQPLSVIAIDIDRFKDINDTHGHAAGDCVLAALAMLLQDAAPPDLGMAGRLGGEEFVIVVPRVGIEAAARVAEGLRAALAARPIDAGTAGIAVTASFGVAQFIAGEEFEDMLARCDEALYRAKRQGRNRVVRAAMPRRRAVA
ncbi:sensor domain-containing diguanylate cyclase [Labrys wisconsinensis]|uniref:diguanylate cyclase n=1 Tax=Labrys wisconsinensis TaxID=425677 RepID=A0ABU0J1N2_9HYPH|nr:sensor domain-containing diguanylate cyclase [Labrys wisconsinensis]MDQ0468161.1 diguanylate cyclase (GGDEF)-like protein [Labrys wisconsinensis]